MNQSLAQISQDIDNLKICVLIPTYNNEKTLNRVIDGVLHYTKNIIIVNDGATDSTAKILSGYTEIIQVHLPKNKGKGNALRVGFKKALEIGYDFAITIDSDGQHFPDDIEAFVTALKSNESKDVLFIGSRDMNQEGVPSKSSFGNKFSNFWFWVETGYKLNDTQSGYRLYPIRRLKDVKLYTNKFEFEIEIIVKAAWRAIEVKNIPVKVLYDETERVSHFRPFKDFTRISILNTWLVFLTFIYIKPRNLFRSLKKKGIKRFFVEDLLGHSDSPTKKALSISLGVFIGLTPLWGFHTFLVLFLAVVLRLNKTIAFAFSNVSIPPFIPFIIYASIKIGQFVFGDSYDITFDELTQNFDAIKHLKTYIVGSFVLATIGAIFSGFIGFLFFSILRKKEVLVKDA